VRNAAHNTPNLADKRLLVSFKAKSDSLVNEIARGEDTDDLPERCLETWKKLKRHKRQAGTIKVKFAVNHSDIDPLEVAWSGDADDFREFKSAVEGAIASWRTRNLLHTATTARRGAGITLE
jgi:hypothetical protein